MFPRDGSIFFIKRIAYEINSYYFCKNVVQRIDMVSDLSDSIRKILALYEGEKAGRIRLEAALAESLADAENLRKQITELERQVDNLKLTQAFTSVGDNAPAKETIEKLIKEIDQCISLLER